MSKTEVEHEQAATDISLRKQAKVALRRRIEAEPPLPTIDGVCGLFQKPYRNNPQTPPASGGSTQQELEAALNIRVPQQQSQEEAWNKRLGDNCTRRDGSPGF